MALEKEDLNQITDKMQEVIEDAIRKSKNELKETISISEGIVRSVIKITEKTLKNDIIQTRALLAKEVEDLGDINRAVTDKVDNISDIEKRLIRVEERLGIKA